MKFKVGDKLHYKDGDGGTFLLTIKKTLKGRTYVYDVNSLQDSYFYKDATLSVEEFESLDEGNDLRFLTPLEELL